MSNPDMKAAAFSAFDASSKRVLKDWHIVKNISKSWDIKNATQTVAEMVSQLDRLSENWQTIQDDLAETFLNLTNTINSSEYVDALETSLREAGIPISGKFPQYDIPPFKFSIALDTFEARLSLGRKIERFTSLNPQELTKWVSHRYKRLTGRKFNQTAFMKELLEAYTYANRLNFPGKTVTWGQAVSLNDLYSLLTMKQSSRQDYPKQFYMYDLGLLKENATISMDRYRFELGTARDQARAITVIDSKGRQDKISSLTIYEEGV